MLNHDLFMRVSRLHPRHRRNEETARFQEGCHYRGCTRRRHLPLFLDGAIQMVRPMDCLSVFRECRSAAQEGCVWNCAAESCCERGDLQPHVLEISLRALPPEFKAPAIKQHGPLVNLDRVQHRRRDSRLYPRGGDSGLQLHSLPRSSAVLRAHELAVPGVLLDVRSQGI